MAGPSYFEQLKTYLASAQSQAGAPLSLVNPDNSDQVVEISMQSLPDRPEGWPEGLPEPIMFENERAAGLAFISADNGETYLLFRDPETSQPIAMSYEDIVHLTDSLMRPIIDEVRADARGYDPYRDEYLPVKDVFSPDLVEIEGGPQDGQVLRQAVLAAEGTIDRFGGNHIGAVIVLVDPSLREGDTPDSAVTRDSVIAGGGQLKDVLIQSKGEMENAILIDQLRAYSTQLSDAIDRDSTTGVNFGANIPLADITDGGVIAIREYDVRPEPAPVEPVVAVTDVTSGAAFDRAGETVGVVIEGPETDLVDGPQDVVPEPTPGFVLANELAGIASTPLTAIQDGGFYNEGKGVRVLEAIRRNLGTPPDPEKVADYFDGRDEYKQIEESWRPIAAQYIQDSVEAGYALPLGQDTKYRQSIDALEQGRVEDAQTLLAGGEVVPQVEVPAEPEAEIEAETEVYSPGRVEPDTDYSDFERMARIEPSAGEIAAADEASLRSKVEHITSQVEGLLSAAVENDGSDFYELTMALRVQAAVSAVRSNFADAVAEDGTIDISKLPVNSEFGDDFTADEQLRQLAERLNGLNEQFGSIDIEKLAQEMDAMGPR